MMISNMEKNTRKQADSLIDIHLSLALLSVTVLRFIPVPDLTAHIPAGI